MNAFKKQHNAPSPPQVWIGVERVGDDDAPDTMTCRFDVAAATALMRSVGFLGAITWQTLGWFISVSMILLGMQKLRTDQQGESGPVSGAALFRNPRQSYSAICATNGSNLVFALPFSTTAARASAFTGAPAWIRATMPIA